ncbi:MAG: hypothetical protein AABX29_07985 [Nanoarchaeota archaeon]
MKLYYIRGVRHNAIVIASNKKEAIKLVVEATSSTSPDSRVLYGSIDKWEVPEAQEVKLPNNYKIVKLK